LQSRDSLYYETGWEPLSCRRKSRKLPIFYKMHNKICPKVGLMKVRYIFDRVCLERVNFSFPRTLTCLKVAFTMLSIWFVQFPSDAKVNPEPLSCRRKSRKLTTFYKMHNKVCLQYLCNCLPPTVSRAL
jgi:hypothetical protein